MRCSKQVFHFVVHGRFFLDNRACAAAGPVDRVYSRSRPGAVMQAHRSLKYSLAALNTCLRWPYVAPPRSGPDIRCPIAVQATVTICVKTACTPVSATRAYGIVSAFRCSAKTPFLRWFSPVFLIHFHAPTGESHGCIGRCTQVAQGQGGQVRRPSLH